MASVTGNAATVTNGIYSSGSYADPTWITSLAGSKVTGGITGDIVGNVTAALASSETITGRITDGASAVGTIIDNSVTLATVGSKLLSIRNNTVEKLYVNKDGAVGSASTTTIYSSLGAGASDVCTVAGSSTADASVNANASLFRVSTGVGGTEVVQAFFKKGSFTLWGAGQSIIKIDGGGANHWEIRGTPDGTSPLTMGNNTATYFGLRTTDGYCFSNYGLEANNGGAGATLKIAGANGLVSQSGTNSSGSPGNATINKPCGISAIAMGASSVDISNSLVTAGMWCMITPSARDAVCKELIAVCTLGHITVSGNGNAAAALPFSWEIRVLL